jgi:hypothetical protein
MTELLYTRAAGDINGHSMNENKAEAGYRTCFISVIHDQLSGFVVRPLLNEFIFPEEITLTAPKILTKKQVDNFYINNIESIDLTFLDNPDPKQITFITKTLSSFD